MYPWFIWKGIDSRSMGVWVSELPAIIRASERTQDISIPGRAGTLTLKEGENVHDGYLKNCRITVRADADFESLLTWLSGEGEAVFSNEPDRSYTARIADEVRFEKNGNWLRTATVPFYVHPHKAQYPPEADITLDASGSLSNPGSVASKPVLTLTFTETCTVVFGESTMALTDAEPAEGESYAEKTVKIDCDAEIITCEEEIWDGSYSGDFPQIPPGASEYALTDCTGTLTPRWRWY